MKGLHECINTWCNKKGVNKTVMVEWEHNVSKAIDKRIEDLVKNVNINNVSDSLDTKEMKSELKKLHDRYVICPIDKAANNVAVICKKFCALVLMKELGLISNNNNNTYNTVTGNTEDEIVTSNVSDLKAKFKVNKISVVLILFGLFKITNL